MSKAMVGRLILEASTGVHGEESKILADAWADMAQQRTDLLEALKIARRELEIWAEADGLDPYNNPRINDVITKAEALE